MYCRNPEHLFFFSASCRCNFRFWHCLFFYFMQGVPMNSLRFLFEGQRIADNQTPKEVQYILPWVKLQRVKGREQKFPIVFDVKDHASNQYKNKYLFLNLMTFVLTLTTKLFRLLVHHILSDVKSGWNLIYIIKVF